MPRLFGTDGVRGIANIELTCELAFKIGQAGAIVLTAGGRTKPTILIGKDTRASSDMLEAAMSAGICSVGANVRLLGVIPTPAVSYLTKRYNADAGVVISASHNPMEYNGIKFFSASGLKLSDDIEDEIEKMVIDGIDPDQRGAGASIGQVYRDQRAVEDYIDYLALSQNVDLSGMKIAVDCANGAASRTAGKLFSRLSCECDIYFASPNGRNINCKCGSTNLHRISDIVKNGGYDIGIAFDGDADRCLVVDESGNVVDGDHIIAACAVAMKEEGTLKGDSVVVTVLTNLGFHEAADRHGIKVVCSNVGDRYVLEKMLEGGYVLGGEQSGHIIFSQLNTTGDGQLTALKYLSVMKKNGLRASQAAAIMKDYPQIMINVKLKSNEAKELWREDLEVTKSIEDAQKILGDGGRVLVRASGTEALIRVMLEGKDQEMIENLAGNIADVIESRFGQ